MSIKIKPKNDVFGVKIVVIIYLIKQDISEVKFIYRKVKISEAPCEAPLT